MKFFKNGYNGGGEGVGKFSVEMEGGGGEPGMGRGDYNRTDGKFT